MVEVNLYLWIGLIVGLVAGLVYILDLQKRMKRMELLFAISMENVAADMVQVDDAIQKITEGSNKFADDLENLRDYVNEKM